MLLAMSSSGGNRSSGPYYADESGTAPYPVAGRRRSRKFILVVTAAAAAVVAGIAAAIVAVVAPGHGSSAGFVPTGSSPEQDAEQITSAFIQAWQHGDLQQAARYTDHPAAAQSALAAYRKYLGLQKLTGAPGSVTAVGGSSSPRESVTLAMSATVSAASGAKTLSGAWSYN